MFWVIREEMLLKEAKEEHRKKYKYTKNPVKIQIGVILDNIYTRM